MTTHYRIHRANALTWCGLKLDKAREARLSVETIALRPFELTSPRFLPTGRIDYTPLTRAEKEEIKAERERLKAAVTCKRCRARMNWS
jgi:hypothetical protein